MKTCNREIIKILESDNIDEIDSDFNERTCQNINPNADMLDFRTEMDQLSFYEKTDFEPCHDLWMVSDAECLWQCIVGEVKTPYRSLANSLGQLNYGCKIWGMIGRNIDPLEIKDFEYYIIETCLKYPEVNNVTHIETKIGNKTGALLCEITIDSIYGTFDGKIRIPKSFPTKQTWTSSKKYFVS